MKKGRRVLVASSFGVASVLIALVMIRSQRHAAGAGVPQAPRATSAAEISRSNTAAPLLAMQHANAAPPPAPPSVGVQVQAPRSFPPEGQAQPAPEGVDGFPDTPAGQAVSKYLLAMSGVGPNAEAEYQASLKNLRRFPAEAVRMVSDVYKSAPAKAYAVKQSAAEALAALKSHEAAKPLAEIANEPVPDSPPGSHADDRQLSEGSMRYTAIRGLGDLAGLGDSAAVASLKGLAATGDPTVRLYAAQAYVESQGYSRAARTEMAALLPESDRMMLEVKPVRADELPQLEPTLQKPLDPSKAGDKPQRDDTAPAETQGNDKGLKP